MNHGGLNSEFIKCFPITLSYPKQNRKNLIEFDGDPPGCGLVIYKGICGNLTLIGCLAGGNDPHLFETDSNDFYYIRVYGDPYTTGYFIVTW